ncbi:MAG: ATP-dependent protease ATPase subunit HslU [Bacteroidota bacterium]
MKRKAEQLTPKQITEELDRYIIGQKDAKRNVAIALRNRWRRMNADPEMQREITPNNILMIGATGVGKTEIARRLARIADAPFVKVEASKFTEVGYVGRDVEGMVRDLVEQSVKMVKARKKEEVHAKALEVVEEIILDAIIPAIKSESPDSEEGELNKTTRDKFRERIRKGELEDFKVKVDVTQGSSTPGIIGPPGMDEVSMMNLQEMISGLSPRKSRKRELTIAEARKMLLEEEASRLIDMDDVKEEAVNRAENTGIIFIDEIDKIAGGNKQNSGGDVSRGGVQRDLLPIVEGSAVNTKYGIVNTDHILFIAAGAFHLSKPSDLIPELQGRFPIRVELDNLTQQDFYHILTAPKSALTKQYIALFKSENVDISFEEDAIQLVAEIAFRINSEVENIGARRLQTVMSHLLNEFLFDMPDTIIPDTKITITREMVDTRLSPMIGNRDLSQYIL